MGSQEVFYLFSDSIENEYANDMAASISAFYSELLGAETIVKPHEHHDIDRLFEAAIYRTLQEIEKGASPYDFRELAILNFVIIAADDGMKTLQIQEFIRELQKNEDSKNGISIQQTSLPPM